MRRLRYHPTIFRAIEDRACGLTPDESFRWLEMIMDTASKETLNTIGTFQLQHRFVETLLERSFDPTTTPKSIRLLLEKGILGRALLPTDEIELDEAAFCRENQKELVQLGIDPNNIPPFDLLTSPAQRGVETYWAAIKAHSNRKMARRAMVTDFRLAIRTYLRGKKTLSQAQKLNIRKRWEYCHQQRCAKVNVTIGVGEALPDFVRRAQKEEMEHMVNNDGSLEDAIARVDYFFAVLLGETREDPEWTSGQLLPEIRANTTPHWEWE